MSSGTLIPFQYLFKEPIRSVGSSQPLGQGLVGSQDEISTIIQDAYRGLDRAQNNLGMLYLEGAKDVEQDYLSAAYWFQLSAKKGNKQAQYNLGYMLRSNRFKPEAHEASFYWIQKAKDNGFEDALNLLGIAYCKGQGVEDDLLESRDAFKRASVHELYGGWHNMGVSALLVDETVPMMKARAFYWIWREAINGELIAQQNLSYLYITGLGVAKDYGEASLWAARAAMRGSVQAQYTLGWLYWSGQGRVKDYRLAKFWLDKAASSGSKHALQLLVTMHAKGQGTRRSRLRAAKSFMQFQKADGSLLINEADPFLSYMCRGPSYC